MKQSEIFEYIEKFEASELTKFELTEGDTKLKLEKAPKNMPAPVQQVIAAPAQVATSQVAQAMPVAPVEVNPEAVHSQPNSALTVDSPIVGTFYKAPAPGAEPFAPVGKKLKEGEVMCMIEAMKMMNEIKAPYDLVVKRVLGVDGELAESGMPLFEVEKC